MPRAVAPWTWRRAIRDHGPQNATSCLVLYVIGTFMDRNGFAFPGQKLLAAGARMSDRTLRRHLDKLERAGWIAIEIAGRTGQGWAHHAYRASVPDSLAIDDLDEGIAEALIAQNGDLEANEGADTAMSTPLPVTTANGADIRGMKVRTNGTEGADTRGHKVRTQLCPINSRSETPAYRTHAPEEAPANAGAQFVEALKGEIRRGAILNPLAKPTLTDPELFGMAERLRRTQGMDVVAEIVATISNDYAGVDLDRMWAVIRRYDPAHAHAKGHRTVVV